jgi:hypothetical protein
MVERFNMADIDESWKKFEDAVKEDAEEVETDEEDETEDLTKAPKDKTSESSEEEEEEDDEDDSEDDSEEPAGDTYKPRLKQFLNEDGTLNAEKIEKSYIETGIQSVKLDEKVTELTKSSEQLRADYNALLNAIKSKPDIAKALFGEEGAKKLADSTHVAEEPKETDPLLRHLKAKMNNASTREYNEFVEEHPEAATDPEKARKIGSFMKLYGQHYRDEHDGEIAPMKEALTAAYRFYGWDEEIKSKEDLAAAAKKAAATRSSGNARQPKSKNEVQMGAEFFARKLGVKLKR